jgi:glycosyltransferase involved in cell wall biosynthesis
MELVSVIIPTLRRPDLLRRALASVFSQSWTSIEVIVVIDGPDAATRALLDAMADPRLTVLRHERSLGPGRARNAGAALARGAWLAFLDDDDEWLPDKLAVQLAGMSSAQPVLLTCRCRVETPLAVYLWPRRLPRPDEPVDDYLFARRSAVRGEAYLATPTFVLPAWLFRRTGFGDGHQYEDTTLLLKVTRGEGATIVMRPEVLVVIHTEEDRPSLGSDFAWRDALRWLDGQRALFTPAGYSGFCLVTLGSQAARVGDWRALPVLLGHALRHGAPTALQLALFAGFWAVPQPARVRLRALHARLRSPRLGSR